MASNDLDLHGYTVDEAIDRFVTDYNTRVDSKQLGCWRIIHGYGSTGEGGVIRVRLRSFLDQHLDKLRYETGDAYGDPGWSFVYPKTRLPNKQERLAAVILDFCSQPKAEEKILSEFATLGEVQVKQTVRSLAKQGKLKAVRKGTKALYQAA